MNFKETTRLHCDSSLSRWLKSIEDPFLESFKPYDENDMPFYTDNQEIEINLPFLKRDFEFNLTNFYIKTQTGEVLFQGKIKDGRIRERIDHKIASNPAWRSRLFIRITDPNASTYENANILINGSFKNGKLHGMTQIFGQMTLDPKGHSSGIIFPDTNIDPYSEYKQVNINNIIKNKFFQHVVVSEVEHLMFLFLNFFF